MHRRTASLLGCLLFALCWGCSKKHGPQVGGDTHWLVACEQNAECGDSGLRCVCGTCTRACSGDAACAGSRDAACFDPQSPLLLQRCEGRVMDNVSGICLARCANDAECGKGRACVQRTCAPASGLDAGLGVDGGQGNVQTGVPSDLSSAVSWSEPVAVPTPQLAIDGADESILGTWAEVNCDPSQVDSTPWWGCVRITVARTATGSFTGTLMWVRPERNPNVSADVRNGPFAPPNPEVGYPSEIAPGDYTLLWSNTAGNVPYRMLDGRFENGTLTFAWAPFDLWHGWCELQKPYLWQIGERQFYFCVPQNEDARASIDEGKVTLCTSADFEPLCDDGHGGLEPCVCLTSDPLCSPAFCHCTAEACDADLHFTQSPGHLTLAEGRLTGTWEIVLKTVVAVTLERVSQ